MPKEKEPTGKGCALWLKPEEPMFSLLADRISRLSQEFSTPPFEPHVTLLSHITIPEEDAKAKCASLARLLKPFRIELGEIGYSQDYFRCLFLRVTSADPILKAHRIAREIFAFRDETAYIPHLSLLYGNLGIESKKGIAATQGFLPAQEFEVRRMLLCHVNDAPRGWKCIGSFDLR